jgi:hypothetical protein
MILPNNRKLRKEVVSSSIPILFFGDLDGYKKSKSLRVVTVGLNPSHMEFSGNNPLKRREHRPFNHKVYVNSLCQYFHLENYHWFNNYEDVLSGMGASYHPGNRNIALHTDLCSPLATKKPWRDLDSNTKKELKKTGLPLWEGLMGYLEPQLILAQIGYREHLQKFGTKESWKTVFVPSRIVGKRNEFRLLRRRFKAHVSTIVHCKPIRQRYGKPFADLTPPQRKRVGKFIRQQIANKSAQHERDLNRI